MGREIHARETRFGRYFEEFELGDVYHHWPGKTITEADDHLFCMMTMNHHPLHTDAHYAETETQFGRNVVVGNLVYSLVLGMSVPDVSGKAIANLEIESLRHARPTFHGDTIYARTTVLEKRESQSKPDRGIVTVETVGWNQREETVCEFRRRVLVPKRPAAAATDVHASIWKFSGDPDVLLARYDAMLAELGAGNLRLHLCLRADDGILMLDAAPSKAAFEALADGDAFRELRERHGLPAPAAVDDYAVHLAYAGGSALHSEGAPPLRTA